MPRTVIFDMDGVLLDSEPLHFAAAQDVCAGLGFEFTEAMNVGMIGLSLHDAVTILIERHGMPGTVADFGLVYEAAILRALSRPLTPNDGVTWLLAELRRRGCRIGLASSSPRSWIEASLQGLGLAEAFDTVVGGDMVAQAKPAPDIYLKAATDLGVRADECLAVEDSPTGLRAARLAGVLPIGLLTSGFRREDLVDARWVIGSLRDFPLELIG